MPIMAFKIDGKEMYPSLFLQSVVGQFTLLSDYSLASMHTANREKLLPHNLCTIMSSLCACPASSAAIECIFSTYDSVWSNIRKSLDAEKADKLVKIY